MWLGVSVSSQGTPDGLAIACAHRYRKVSSSYCHGYGMCLSMSNQLDEMNFWNPCESKEKGHQYYGYCQSGTSVDLAEDGELLMGLPGPFVWRGAIMKNLIQDDFTDLRDPKLQKEYWSPVEDLKKNEVGPEPATDFYSYLGSSTKIGRILGGEMTYVSGAPRAKEAGQVLLFTEGSSRLEISQENYLTGDQFGSNFGHEVAIVDLNNDGLNDLVVSAPFYLDKHTGGAIYVFMNSAEGITATTENVTIYSRTMGQTECTELNCEEARFGFSLASLGDLDGDGYQDIAVGAPYEGNGAVYVFRGSHQGIVSEYSQRIYADDLLTVRPLDTFGYSLSGGIDMDESTYPDLLVGAYNSNKVITLRSRPVINIRAGIIINQGTHIVPGRCAENGRSNGCFDLRTCFSFTAEPSDRFPSTVDITYRLEAVEKFTLVSRVYFDETDSHILEKQTMARKDDEILCVLDKVYIRSSTKDFLNPIPFELTWSLVDNLPPTMTPSGALPDMNTYPILNQTITSKPFLAEFEKKCGDDNECQCSLHLGASFNLPMDGTSYVLKDGQKEALSLFITVSNSNEDAHETTLTLDLPPSVDYTDVSTDAVKCTPIEKQVLCSVGNPLVATVNFTLILQPTTVESGMSTMSFAMVLNSTSTEIFPEDDELTVNVRVIVETDLLIRGYSQPREVEFSGEVVGESAISTGDDIGSSIIHTYEVVNDGSGTVANASVLIKWPFELNDTKYAHGKHLLYLLGYPVVQPPAPCYLLDKNIEVNPLGIEADETVPVVPYVEVEGEEGVRVDADPNRQKRDASEPPQSVSSGNIVTLDCDTHTARCMTFRCDIGRLVPDRSSSIVIHMKSRLWNSTFLEEFLNVDKVHINSKAWIVIPPHLNVKQYNTLNDVRKVMTVAQPALVAQVPKEVPLWVIIVSAVAGLIVLLLIVLLLWKCGFFKRTTQDEMKKHQAEVKKSDFGYD